MVIYAPAVRIAMFALVVIACSDARTPTPAPAPPTVTKVRPSSISNIQPADYIGPEACADCHVKQHTAWSTSLHRRMNQRASAEAVIGNFATELRYRGGIATFSRVASEYRMTVARAGKTTTYRVTRTIGVRALQEYVGVDISDANAVEVRLPFAWWPKRVGWYPQPYFDPWFAKEDDFDPYAPVREAWAERCPWCHSTYPFAQRIARASVRDVGHGMEQFFTAPGGSETLAVAEQVTTGISCESCHLGGAAHAKTNAPMHFVPLGAEPRDASAPVATTFAQERADPQIVNRVCAQCHSGPSPRLADGTALRNSSEALDLAASSCTTARCTDCHDPHTGGANEARAIAACTSCHAQLADPTSVRAHAGAEHSSATCLDCHMPRMVMGIDKIVRTHRIQIGKPNACILCHVDRSLAWIEGRAEGADDHPMGDVWMAGKEPALRILAADAYARSKLAKSVLPQLLAQLVDPLPHVRAYTLFAVEAILGRRVDEAAYDPRTPRRVRTLR